MNWARVAFWREDRQSGEECQKNTVVQQLYEIGSFVRSLRTKLRFGEMSRAPIRLVRFQLQGRMAECDWVARVPDEWEMDLPVARRERTATRQALEDAIAVRRWLFCSLPDVEFAAFRVYRQSGDEPLELIMTGSVTRDEPTIQVLSLAMRAKLYGFQFWLNNGVMEPLGT